MGKGKELEFPEERGGGKGRRSQSDLNLIARSAMGQQRSPGVPPIVSRYNLLLRVFGILVDTTGRFSNIKECK